MNKISTQKDLLRYAYNETGLSDSDRIQRCLDGDPVVQDEYREIIRVMSVLDQGSVTPGEDVLKRILDFSKSGSGE